MDNAPSAYARSPCVTWTWAWPKFIKGRGSSCWMWKESERSRSFCTEKTGSESPRRKSQRRTHSAILHSPSPQQTGGVGTLGRDFRAGADLGPRRVAEWRREGSRKQMPAEGGRGGRRRASWAALPLKRCSGLQSGGQEVPVWQEVAGSCPVAVYHL